MSRASHSGLVNRAEGTDIISMAAPSCVHPDKSFQSLSTGKSARLESKPGRSALPHPPLGPAAALGPAFPLSTFSVRTLLRPPPPRGPWEQLGNCWPGWPQETFECSCPTRSVHMCWREVQEAAKVCL